MSLPKLLSNIPKDVRFAVRVLLKNRSFALTAILTLALGSSIGISIYTLVYGLVQRPLSVKDHESVVKLYEEVQADLREVSGSPYMFSYPEYTYYRDNNKSFSDLIAYAETSFQVGGAEGGKVPALLVTPNYFSALGAGVERGRVFTREEGETPGASPVAVISHRLWEQRFSSDPAIVGRVIAVNNVPLTVVGVATPDTVGTELTIPDLFVPVTMEPQLTGQKNLPKQNCSWLTLVGRLKPGVPVERAQAEMGVLASHIDAQYPDRTTRVTVTKGSYLGSPEEAQVVSKIMIPITVAVVFILLIVFTNVSNLFLARTVSRQKELGMRLALGASRGRLIQQLLTESLLVGVLGGLLGLALSNWLLASLKAFVPAFPSQLQTTPDISIFTCTLVIALFSGVSAGLVPAIMATRFELNSLIKQESMGPGKRKSSNKLRGLLVAVQLAGCLLLLISTTLLIRGFYRARSLDLGFRTENLYLVALDLRQQQYDEARAAVFNRLLSERLASAPGVKSVALATTPPLLAKSQTPVTLDGREETPDNQTSVYNNIVSWNYLDTVGIKVVRGRDFSAQDERGGAQVAIVNERMAARFWPNQDAVGKVFKASGRRLEVVGVAQNVQNVQLNDRLPFFYSLPGPGDQLGLNLMVRTEGRGGNLLATVTEAVRSIDPVVNVSAVSMEGGLDRLLQPSKVGILLTSALGLLALLLATVGVYGVTSYAVSQRLHEIGMRMVLGSPRARVILLFIRQAGWIIAAGVLLGAGLAAAASTLLADLLYGVNGVDPFSFVGATAALITIALVAVYLPVRRATKRNPLELIR